MYRWSHISKNEIIEAIGFDGEFWIMSDMWLLSVSPMLEFWEPKIKVCEVDIKIMLGKNCWGPPTSSIVTLLICSITGIIKSFSCLFWIITLMLFCMFLPTIVELQRNKPHLCQRREAKGRRSHLHYYLVKLCHSHLGQNNPRLNVSFPSPHCSKHRRCKREGTARV